MTSRRTALSHGLSATLVAVLTATSVSWAAQAPAETAQTPPAETAQAPAETAREKLRNIFETLCDSARQDVVTYEWTTSCRAGEMEFLMSQVGVNGVAESVANAFRTETGVELSRFSDFLPELLGGSGPDDPLRIGSYHRYSFRDVIRLGVAPFVDPDSLSSVGTAYAVPMSGVREEDLHRDVIRGSVAVATRSSDSYELLLPPDERWNEVLTSNFHDDDFWVLAPEDADSYVADGHTPVISWNAQAGLHGELLTGYWRVLYRLVWDAVGESLP